MQLAPGRSGAQPTPWPVISVVLGSWALMVLLLATGHTDLLAHHAVLADHTIPRPATLLLFVVAWQVMTGAMMLPSSLPMVGLFAGASRGQERPRLVLATFLAAYFAVWTGFALVALTFDAGLHALVDRWRWLDAHPQFIAGPILILAGAFQFSPLKERCLTACRNPVSFLWRHYGRGAGRAWNLGLRHGIFCLGCCWALMLVMFAVGVGSIAWMAGLTGVMTIEKTSRSGRRLVPAVGAALLLWGAVVLIHPTWLPAAMRG